MTNLTAPSSDSSPTNGPPPRTLRPTRTPDRIVRRRPVGEKKRKMITVSPLRLLQLQPPLLLHTAGRHICYVSPPHTNASEAAAPNRECVCHLSASSAISSGVMTGLPTVARRPALALETRSEHAKHWRPITTSLRGRNK